jgi:hypothetical protein
MLELILKITLAHLLGDFVFQTNKMVADIDTNKLKSKYLYFHTILHLLLLLIVTSFEKQYILPSIVLAVTHLLIDIFTKIIIRDKINAITNLLIDQILHIIAIAIFINYFHDYNIDFNYIFSTQNYLLFISLVSITYVSAILMKKIMPMLEYPFPNDGIKEAGKYIGMLERLFIFIFIITSFWEGVGFLLAAKSIFRFGDLKENKEIKLTEYILIGTLISFGLAILIAGVYLKLKSIL